MVNQKICSECERQGNINLAHYEIKSKFGFSRGVPRIIYLCKQHLATKTLDEINGANKVHIHAGSINSVIILHEKLKRATS